MNRLFYGFVRVLFKILLSIFFRIKVYGVENIPKEGPALFISNHPGVLDMFFVGYSVKTPIHYMAKSELFKSKLLGFILKKLGAYPVRRGAGDIASVKMSYDFLQNGEFLGIFPEGTRVGKQKNIKPSKGAAVFAIKSQAIIQPVALDINYSLFGKANIIYGKPYKLNLDKDMNYEKEDLTKISKEIMDNVYMIIDDFKQKK